MLNYVKASIILWIPYSLENRRKGLNAHAYCDFLVFSHSSGKTRCLRIFSIVENYEFANASRKTYLIKKTDFTNQKLHSKTAS